MRESEAVPAAFQVGVGVRDADVVFLEVWVGVCGGRG